MARLAQLTVGAEEAERIATEMSRVLEYADRLRVAPGAGEVDQRPGFRSDASDSAKLRPGSASAQSERMAPNAPDALQCPPAEFAPRFEQGFFVVPPPPGVIPEADAVSGAHEGKSGAPDG